MSVIPAYNDTNNLLVCHNFDNSIRWHPGERLDHLFEKRCDSFQENSQTDHLAVCSDQVRLSYLELDQRANQLARHLLKQGFGCGDCIGLLFDKSAYTYVSLLAVLKINAAYVPLDAAFPKERITYIASDANIKSILTLSVFESKFDGINLPIIFTDTQKKLIDVEATDRLTEREKGTPISQLCYIIYTSGSTGNPKGVAINHSSICNFVNVAGETYGLTNTDRMYQGLTIAFDFSVEEIWVSLIVGATLVPGQSEANLLGDDLAQFLTENKITAMCCVPTLLASISQDLPQLRYLLVSGEACPHDLVTRWYHPDRVFINAYGPTEATVTATITNLHPDKPVTIGGPLPTYTIVILDENENRILEKGDTGEVCIAGIGLAEGYQNRPDLTDKSFIPDFIGIDNNPSQRIYRTGDLGFINDRDEVEYLGRIDTQVKIRGYRIELTEIESAILNIPEISQAVVDTYEQTPGTIELVAYYSLKQDANDILKKQLQNQLRQHLPAYMIPVFFEKLSSIPMLPSHKADRKNLPTPKGVRIRDTLKEVTHPSTDIERFIASALSNVLLVDEISVEDDFFSDLAAHSLLMARFASKVREHPLNPDISMRDIYTHSTVRQLAKLVQSKSQKTSQRTKNAPHLKPSTISYYTCGVLQLLFYYSHFFISLLVLVQASLWIFSESTISTVLIRTFIFSALSLVIFTIYPVIMKWILVGKWKSEKIPIWSLQYFRFWAVKQLIQNNPIVLFKDTPIYNLYLRSLGAKIGKHAVILSQHVPVCTDLLDIGNDTILRKDSIILGYKAEAGYIHTGHITIGENSLIGEASLIDIEASIGNNSQLGHSSYLQSGQNIPSGKNYHGSPAQETTTNYNSADYRNCSTARRFIYTAVLLVSSLLLLPAVFYGLHLYFPTLLGEISSQLASQNILTASENIRAIIISSTNRLSPWFILTSALVISVILFAAVLLLRLVSITVLPRLFNLFIDHQKTYPLYGFHYFIFRAISWTSNSYFFNKLFGDSSYILPYLNSIGFHASTEQQLGSNFGQKQKHDSPFLSFTGSGTMVSDGLSMINADISSHSFKLRETAIGDQCFLGNNIYYPSDSKLGNNCMMATKALIPIDGSMRNNIGVLGSPGFEIPRQAGNHNDIELFEEPTIRQQRLHKKNRFNLYTITSFLALHWLFLFSLIVYSIASLFLFANYGIPSLLISLVLLPIAGIAYFVFIEKLSLGFRRLTPNKCSIYHDYFWRIEHYWTYSHSPTMGLFKGTPFKNIISRLLGIKMGRMVFDDGAYVSEKTMVSIGDYCNLNENCALQCHSLEDGIFKSDYIKVGSGSTIGCNAFVHYGVTIGDNAVLAPDSFLMKGEHISSNRYWQGNPAQIS